MKVSDLKAEAATVDVTLEPEHPAEIALINLMGQCEAECVVMQPPSPQETTPEPKLRITVQVKKNTRGY